MGTFDVQMGLPGIRIRVFDGRKVNLRWLNSLAAYRIVPLRGLHFNSALSFRINKPQFTVIGGTKTYLHETAHPIRNKVVDHSASCSVIDPKITRRVTAIYGVISRPLLIFATLNTDEDARSSH